MLRRTITITTYTLSKKGMIMHIGKSLLAAAAMLTVLAPAAQAEESRTFTHEGATYTYRTIDKGDSQVLVGTSEYRGIRRDFTLTVKNGRVRGDVDGRSVAFATPKARARNVQLAAD
jgi:hypothetical protein